MSIRFSFTTRPLDYSRVCYKTVTTGFTVRYKVEGKKSRVTAGKVPGYRSGSRKSSAAGDVLSTTRTPLGCREVLVKEHISMRKATEKSAVRKGIPLTIVDPDARQDLTGGLLFVVCGLAPALQNGIGMRLLHMAVGLPFLYMARTDRKTLKRLRNFDFSALAEKDTNDGLELNYDGVLNSRVMSSAELSCSLLAGLGRAALRNYLYLTSTQRQVVEGWAKEAVTILSSADTKAAKVLLEKVIYFLVGAANWEPDVKPSTNLPAVLFTRTAPNLQWVCSAIFAPMTQSTSLISMKTPRGKKKSYSTGILSLKAASNMEQRSALDRKFLLSNAAVLGVTVSRKK